MSIRANSLQSVVRDGIYFTALAGLVAATLSTIARGADPQVVAPAELTDRRLTDDHIDSQLNTDDNRASGDPTESPAAKREAMMLGMKLYERRKGQIMVVDVAATSPAWDAGIRPGDRLVSIDTLRPTSLAPWVGEIGKVLKDTPDGKSVAAMVERKGEELSLHVKLPVSKAAEARDARQEEEAIAEIAAGQQQQPLQQQGVAVGPGGGDMGGVAVPVGGGGVVGYGVGGYGGYDDGPNPPRRDDRLAQTAVAQLTSASQMPRGTAEEQVGQMQSGQGVGGQVGLATFEDTNGGVQVDVLVRGLPRGTYQVGIGQGAGMGGAVGGTNFGNGAGNGYVDGGYVDDGYANGGGVYDDGQAGQAHGDPSSVRNRGRGGRFAPDGRSGQPNGGGAIGPQRNLPQNGLPQNGANGMQPMPNAVPNGPAAVPNGAPAAGGVPAGGGVGAGGGAGGGDAGRGASLADPNGSGILAQQIDIQPGAGAAAQPAGSAAPGNLGSRVVGQGRAGGGSDISHFGDRGRGTGQQSVRNDGSNLNGNAGPQNSMGSPFVAQIGVLQVGADGSARVQNRLEGMQVQNLVGMSVNVVSEQGMMGQGVASPNGVGVPGGNGQVQNAQHGQVQSGNGRYPDNRPTAATGGQALGGQDLGSQGVVATGVIQVTNGQQLPNMGNERRNPGSGQPTDRATEEQQNRVPFSDPRQDFDPSTSQ